MSENYSYLDRKCITFFVHENKMNVNFHGWAILDKHQDVRRIDWIIINNKPKYTRLQSQVFKF